MHGSLGMLAGLLLGMVLGALVPASMAAWVDPIGLLWFNALRMTVIPIVMAQLILGLNTQVEARALGALGLRAFAWFVALLASTASFSAVAMSVLLRWMPSVPPATGGPAPGAVPGFGAWLADLLPSNVLQAAAEGKLLPLILFAVLFGAALRAAEGERRRAVLAVVGGVNDAMLTIVGWVMRVAPYGVAALAVTLVSRLGSNAVGAFGYYVLCFCGIEIALTAALYPLVWTQGKVDIRRWAVAMAPIQALGFGSRSSMAALPAMVAAAEQRLGLGPAVSGFILPLAVSVFRYSTPVSHVTGALFVAHLYGMELSALQVLIMIVTTVFLSFSSPGIPSGGLLVALPLFHQLGLPPEGLGLLIAADAVPDMFKTLANVTAHMAVATVVAPPGATLGE
jgi:proton glutamate symport protein